MILTHCDYKRGIELFLKSDDELKERKKDLFRELGQNFFEACTDEDTLSKNSRRDRIVKEIQILNWIIEKKVGVRVRSGIEIESQHEADDFEIEEGETYATNFDVVEVDAFDAHGGSDSLIHHLRRGDKVKVLAHVKNAIECLIIDEGLNFLTNESEFKTNFIKAHED